VWKGDDFMEEKNTGQDIINAAVRIFIEKGKDGARMQEIADKAGVNKMLLHYYFKDKNTLFLEVVKKIVVDLYDNVIEESMNTLTFREFFSVFIDRHFDFLNERKEYVQFLLWELSRKQLDLKEILSGSYTKSGGNPFDILTSKLNDAVEKGEIHAVDSTDFILNLFSLDLFLFIAMPVIREIAPMDDMELANAIKSRKKEVFRLLWNDIKN
jgi:TetR/AcrR family transcriptional regulator